MKNTFSVKNWDEFQHYKDRNPPWIKLHNHLLDDYEFECLSDIAKGHLLCIWMLASRTKNVMPYDEKWITKKIGASSKVNLIDLVGAGFIVLNNDASNVLHNKEQDGTRSVPSEEERRGEKSINVLLSLKKDGFAYWWERYPKKTAKPDALQAFNTATKKMKEDSFKEFIDLISYDSQERYKTTDRQFIPSPAKYLRKELYNDDRE